MHYSCKMRYSVVIKAKIEFLLYFQGLCMDISILHCWYVVSASLMICTLTFLNWNIIFSHSCTCMLLWPWFRTAAKYCLYNITTSLYINVCIKIFGNLLTRIVVKKIQWKKMLMSFFMVVSGYRNNIWTKIPPSFMPDFDLINKSIFAVLRCQHIGYYFYTVF